MADYIKPESVTVSSLVLVPLVSSVEKAGVSANELLSRVGLSPDVLQDRDARVAFQPWVEMWRLAAEMTGNPALGIHAGESVESGVFGVIDYVTRCSRTLGEGIERSCRYYPLIHDAARPSLERYEDHCIWSYNLKGGLQYPRVLAEYALACWLVACRQGMEEGLDLDPLEVHFVHEQSVNTKEYERFFRAPVKLGADRNAMVLDIKTLDRTLTGAKEGLCEILDRYAQQLLEKLPTSQRFSQRVRELIAAELAGGDPSAEGIALRLRMSSRTLRRRLKEEGSSHRYLLEQQRKDLAVLYLKEKGLAVSEAAFLLGFADASAFHKAFKRWTGQTPIEYRRENQT